MVDTASLDEVLEPKMNSSLLVQRIRGAREIVRPVGHFAYVPLCKPVIGRLMARAAGTPICDDPPGVDRSRLHDQVAADVVGFFDAQLKPARQAP